MELCRLDELRDAGARGFSVPGFRHKVIVVYRHGRVFAYLDACPHYAGGTPMAWKKDAYLNGDGTHLACHSHGALFDIETGRCVLGPCRGQSLQPVSVRVSKRGGIEIAADVSSGG